MARRRRIWIREDATEIVHPKTLRLLDLAGYEGYFRIHQLRQWCALNETGGVFDAATARGLGVRQKTLDALVEVGLVERDDGNGRLVVHDFGTLNPSPGALRQRRWRDGKRDASETEDETLRETAGVTQGVTERAHSVTPSPRALAPADATSTSTEVPPVVRSSPSRETATDRPTRDLHEDLTPLGTLVASERDRIEGGMTT